MSLTTRVEKEASDEILQQHKHYCGIDLHARMMYLCILDANDTVLLSRNIDANPKPFLAAQGIRPDDLYKVFMGVQRFFDYIVIDAGSSLTENTVTLMDSADRLMLVTTPDLAALHDASRFVQIARTLSYPDEKLMIVLNRAGLLGGVKTKDIETALHHQIYATVPDDPAICVAAASTAVSQ